MSTFYGGDQVIAIVPLTAPLNYTVPAGHYAKVYFSLLDGGSGETILLNSSIFLYTGGGTDPKISILPGAQYRTYYFPQGTNIAISSGMVVLGYIKVFKSP